MIRKRPLSLLLAGALMLSACSGEFGSSYFAPTAALVCGGIDCVKIPETRLVEQLSQIMEIPEQARPFRGPMAAQNRLDAQREILATLIREEVALQRARLMKITPDSVAGEAEAALKEMRAQAPSAQEFDQNLESGGITLERLKEYLVYEAMLEKVRTIVGKDSAATPAEIEQFYNLNKSQYDEQVNISHILVCGNLNALERQCGSTPEDDRRALEALGRARAGEDFATLAREYSADELSAQNGGVIGFVSRGDLVPQLETAAFSLLLEGEISEPVRSQFGIHIVKLNKAGKPLTEARADIERGLTLRKLTKAFDEWFIAAIKQARIKVNSKLGQYDPISQTVIPLTTKKAPVPAGVASPQPATESTSAPEASGGDGAPAGEIPPAEIPVGEVPANDGAPAP
ncbi:MAG: peptidylprolyl isomerase [Actinomycetota bacterium]